MSTVRSGSPGATRVCPHCKATVLESAAICPGCRHHLRFGGTAHPLEPGEGYCALSVDGTIAHTKANEPSEYCVVLDVRDDRGEQITRQVVGVGVLQGGEKRRLNVSVELMPVRQPGSGKPAQAPAPTAAPAKPAAATPPPAQPVRPAAASAPAAAKPAVGQPPPAPTRGPQQPAAPLSSAANTASMQRLGVIRKPR